MAAECSTSHQCRHYEYGGCKIYPNTITIWIILSVIVIRNARTASKFSQLKIRHVFTIEAEHVGLFDGLSIKFSRLASWRLELSEGEKTINVMVL